MTLTLEGPRETRCQTALPNQGQTWLGKQVQEKKVLNESRTLQDNVLKEKQP